MVGGQGDSSLLNTLESSQTLLLVGSNFVAKGRVVFTNFSLQPFHQEIVKITATHVLVSVLCDTLSHYLGGLRFLITCSLEVDY